MYKNIAIELAEINKRSSAFREYSYEYEREVFLLYQYQKMSSLTPNMLKNNAKNKNGVLTPAHMNCCKGKIN